jgi:outer membrane receptor protein involved in Fe transport
MKLEGVDGVGQQSRMNDINPNDIESVKVLKGASKQQRCIEHQME